MKYFAKKTLTLIITLFMISIATFFVFQIIPGDAVANMLGTEATPEREEALRQQLGLDEPVPVRYIEWIKGVAHGDFGRSYRYAENMNEMMSVSRLIGDKLPVTLTLAVLSLIMTVILGFFIGIVWAGCKSRTLDAVFGIITQGVMAVPSFFLGILIIFFFGIILRLFTPGQYVSYHDSVAGFFGYLIFPAFAMAIPKSAMAARFLRNAILEQGGLDYVRTAKSKGCTDRRIMWRHILRNAIIPVITFMGTVIAEIVAGSIVVEQVFSVPRIGRLLVSSISTRDFPVVQTLILYIAVAVMVVYYIVDIIYGIVDPRMRSNED